MNTKDLRNYAYERCTYGDVVTHAKITQAADEIDRLHAESQRYRVAMLEAENMLQTSRALRTASPAALDAQIVLQKALKGGE